MADDLQKAAPVTVKQSGCPAGSYSAVFQGAFVLPPKKDGPNYGPAFILRWKTDNGLEPSAIVSQQPTLRNKAGKLLAVMAGKALEPDQVVDYGQFEGDRHTVIVTTNALGTGTAVSELVRA